MFLVITEKFKENLTFIFKINLFFNEYFFTQQKKFL